jgi:hypothetical protein
VFIMAHRNDQRLEGRNHWNASSISPASGPADTWASCQRDVWPSRPGQPQHAWEPPRVVANSQGKRAGSGQQLCGEECGQGRALPFEFDNSGEVVGNAESGQDNGREPRDLGKETIQGGRFNNAPDCSGASVGNAENSEWRSAQGEAGHAAQPDESMGNASNNDGRHIQERSGALRPELTSWREIKSALGRDTNGATSGLDYAELCESCDNRTDELRLLGNGVVPATAALAFRTLLSELQ